MVVMFVFQAGDPGNEANAIQVHVPRIKLALRVNEQALVTKLAVRK